MESYRIYIINAKYSGCVYKISYCKNIQINCINYLHMKAQVKQLYAHNF